MWYKLAYADIVIPDLPCLMRFKIVMINLKLKRVSSIMLIQHFTAIFEGKMNENPRIYNACITYVTVSEMGI